jgi:hypothetical protein
MRKNGRAAWSFSTKRMRRSLRLPGIVLVPTLRADFYGHAINANRDLSELLARERLV